MSEGSSPNHRFSGTYDGYYDPDFTADISHKMQVPDRISLMSDQEAIFKAKNLHNDFKRLQMHVPDRILLTGDGHLEDRDIAPELRLENSLHGPPNVGIQLNNPPHNLTLENHHYPAIEEEEPRKNDPRQKQSISYTNHSSSQSSHAPHIQYENGYSLSPTTPPGNQQEDELTLLRRQVRSLSRRVHLIEQDNQQLHQREVVFCTGVVLYFLMKGIVWLNRNW